MAETMVKPLEYRADLDGSLKKTTVDTLLVTDDENAHRFDIAMYRGQTEAALPSGASVTGYFIRYADDVTVPLDGEIDGNVVSVTLKAACYRADGSYALIIKIAAGDTISTVFYGEGHILSGSTDTYNNDEELIPSLDELLAKIAQIELATANAGAAAEAANTAAATANANAQTAAVASANASAKAEAADTAAETANAAAAKIDGMTVSAQAAETADGASATVTEENGAKHIAFRLPRGNTGVTPQITFTVATGAAGSQAQIDQGGTAENPTIHLTIPRGDTGAVDGIDYYTGTPNAPGTASPGTANGVSRGDHVHPMPSAEDVGALGKSETAANAEKLGGKPAAEYIATGAKTMQIVELFKLASVSVGSTIELLDDPETCAGGFYGSLDSAGTMVARMGGGSAERTIILTSITVGTSKIYVNTLTLSGDRGATSENGSYIKTVSKISRTTLENGLSVKVEDIESVFTNINGIRLV